MTPSLIAPRESTIRRLMLMAKLYVLTLALAAPWVISSPVDVPDTLSLAALLSKTPRTDANDVCSCWSALSNVCRLMLMMLALSDLPGSPVYLATF